MKNNYTLGIESSCDEAAIGIISEGKVIYQDLYSSAKIQAMYGGVIPEVASRLHEKNFNKMLLKLKSNFDISKITNIVYTAYPGLIGGLHVANVFANTLAWQLNIRVIPINHIYGHIFSAMIGRKEIQYPFLALVVSGKTSSIYKVNAIDDIEELIKTTDDACGECLDKIGRKLGISYPAGKEIDDHYSDQLACIKLIPHGPKENNFSFSGFKTHILNLINKNNNNKTYTTYQITSSAMNWIVEEIIRKLQFCAEKYHINKLFIGGGVSASNTLKNKLLKQSWLKDLYLTELKYTGDNGVMIAYYGEKLFQSIDDKNITLKNH